MQRHLSPCSAQGAKAAAANRPRRHGMRAAGLAVAILASQSLMGCTTLKDAPNLATIGLSFEWTEASRCSNRSPAFTLENVPPGTATLQFRMVDLDFTAGNHGGGTVRHDGGNTVPAGALLSFAGPCPPVGPHRYEVVVTAVNAAGDTVLGRGKAMRPFPAR